MDAFDKKIILFSELITSEETFQLNQISFLKKRLDFAFFIENDSFNIYICYLM